MRQILFYLSVALLAFGLSSFFAIKIYRANSFDSVKDSVSFIQEQKVLACPILSDERTIRSNCENEVVNTVWTKLKKNTGAGSIDDDVITGNIKSCEDLFYEPRAIDLNNDKVEEVILMGEPPFFCGSGGDCQTWILSKINNRYEIIFEGRVGEDFENIQFLKEKTHNFQNLKIKINNGWESNDFGLFKFDGKQYRIKECFEDVNSSYDYDNINKERLISVKLKKCL